MPLRVLVTNLEDTGFWIGETSGKRVIKAVNNYYIVIQRFDGSATTELRLYHGTSYDNFTLVGTLYTYTNSSYPSRGSWITPDINYNASRNSIGVNYASAGAYHYFREIALASDGTPTIGSQVTVFSGSTLNRAGCGVWGTADTYWATTSYPYWVHLFYGLTSFTQRWTSGKSYGYTRVDMDITHLGNNRVVIVFHGYNNNNLYFTDVDLSTAYKTDADTGLDTDVGASYMTSFQVTYNPDADTCYLCFRKTGGTGIAKYDIGTQTWTLLTTIGVVPPADYGLACAVDKSGTLHILVLDSNNRAYIRYYTFDGTNATLVQDIPVPSGYGSSWSWLSRAHYYGGDGYSNTITALARTDTGRLVILEIVPEGILWLQGWSCRKKHLIVGSTAGSVSDYQIKITVHYGSGTDSGEHVYLNGKCRADFGDVRFTDADGGTELPYWIEKKVDGDYAIFWVKVPYIPANPGTTTIYIYYNNPNATTTSNGSATFKFFDDLEVWSGWENVGSGAVQQTSAYVYQGNYALQKYNACDPSGGRKPLGFTLDRNNWIVEFFRRRNAGEGTDCYADRTGVEDANGNGYSANFSHGSSPFICVDKRTNGQATLLGRVSTTDILSEWYIAQLILTPSTVKVRILRTDYTLHTETSVDDTTYTSFTYIYIRGGRPYYVDVIRIRKYIDPEPTHSDWGSEECLGIYVSLVDSLSLSDLGFIRDVTKVLTDTMSLSDALAKALSRILSDSMTLSDVLGKAIAKAFTDSMSLTDHPSSKGIVKALSDSVALKEYMGWVYPYLDPKKPLDRLIAVLDTLDRMGYRLEHLLDDPYIVYLIRYMARKARGEI